MNSMRLVRLGDVATIEREQVEATHIPSGTLYVGLENIETGGQLIDVRPVERGELGSSKFRFTPAHLLFGKLRPYLAKIARPNFSGICSTDILPLLPGRHADRSYLAWTLLNPLMVARATSLAAGANLPRISPQALADLKIPLPELSEQRRIADILDKADALRAKRRAALARLDTLIQSIFLDIFGDASSPKFGMVKLEELCTRITDGTHQPPRWSPHGHPFLFVSNVITGEITFESEKYISDETHAELTRRCPIEVGDVLYSTVGSYGVPALVRTNRKFAFQRHIAHLKPDRRVIEPEFLKALMSSPHVTHQADRAARGVAQKTINLADIRQFDVVFPSLEAQRRFVDRMRTFDQLKNAEESSAAYLDSLFASLQHRAFRGEL